MYLKAIILARGLRKFYITPKVTYFVTTVNHTVEFDFFRPGLVSTEMISISFL